MAMRLSGELPAGEVERAVYAVHFWAKDTRNHRYLRAQTEDLALDVLKPQCSRERYPIPGRWAFRSELSQELDDGRDRARDCRPCFRRRG